jgi:hypothetical protein
MLKMLTGWLLVAAGTALIGAQSADIRREDTVLAGVYSAEQAARGQEAFLQNCARCHRADLGGQNARPLKGQYFLDHWREFKLELLFNQIRANMPPPDQRRGEISDQTYLDIMTFLLQGNGLPTGPRELKIDQLDKITLVGPNGPQPPPSSSMVHVVACFREVSDNVWGLAKSSRPVRTLLTELTADERAEAANWTIGEEYYYLQSIDGIPNFIPENHLNAKVHAKGYYIAQPNRERINLTALEVIDDDCK